MKKNPYYTSYLRPYSQKLRREMTKEEKHLWYDYLKDLPCTAKRQQVIGPYIVDFYIASCRVVIELDGNQHGDDEMVQADIERDRWLANEGFQVLRYTNQQIRDQFYAVCEDIESHLKDE